VLKRCTDVWATAVWATNFFEITIWATRVGRLDGSSWTFERHASIRLGDKNEALRFDQPQIEGRVSDYQYLVASGRI